MEADAAQGSTEQDRGFSGNRGDDVEHDDEGRAKSQNSSDTGKRKLPVSESTEQQLPTSTTLELQERSKRPKINFGMMSSSSRLAMPGSATSSSDVVPAIKPPKPATPISIKLGAQKPKEQARVAISSGLLKKASVFNADDDDEEEMPPEARMRMRNVGRETPTSTGPNSFGKTSQGFCDTRLMFEKELKKSSRGHDPGHK